MGHQIYYNVFPENKNVKEIYDIVNQVAIKEGDYHSPLEAIDFRDRCFNSRQDAEEYIEKLGGFYLQVAVKFKENENFKPSKKLEGLKKKLNIATRELYEKKSAFHFKDMKSSSVTCKKCGSRITLSYLKSNYCPVCHNDMRPETIIKKISEFESKVQRLNEEVQTLEKAERIKDIKNAKVFWLVKTEFHV